MRTIFLRRQLAYQAAQEQKKVEKQEEAVEYIPVEEVPVEDTPEKKTRKKKIEE